MKKIVFLLIACGAIQISCRRNTATESFKTIEGQSIISEHGMVVSAHAQASEAGVSVLKRGGNAIDAAVATQFALAVCYPAAGNIGGGGFMVIRTSNGACDVIDFREKAPLKASRDMYLDPSGNVIEDLSTETHLAAGVPGTVDGMVTIHEKYGKLKFRDVIQPSIDLASNGFTLTGEQAASLNYNRDIFLKKNKTRPAFVSDSTWEKGDILKQPDLAKTLERIRDNGRAGFYSGETARLIVSEMERGNGLISAADLDDYHSVFRKPVTTEYRGYRLFSVPPPSGGGIILFQLLGMAEPYPLKEMGFHSPESIHLIVEAERRSFADRAQYSGDPDFINVPVSGLIDKRYLAKRMADFNPRKASSSADISAGYPAPYESSETTHFSVVDKSGNAVAVTTTLNGGYGNRIIVGGAGFFLNNEMDDFSVKPGVPNMYGLTGSEANSVQPGKRMLSSMTPVIVEKDGKLFLLAGSPGGSTIPTTVYQVIINVIDYNMSIAQAVDTGRFHHQWLPDTITSERGSIDSLGAGILKSMGHDIKVLNGIGRVNAILILADGKISGAADKRGNNSACGY
jgi:gamma-glutamyltranspeptidase/glutathione hydrolase